MIFAIYKKIKGILEIGKVFETKCLLSGVIWCKADVFHKCVYDMSRAVLFEGRRAVCIEV